MFWERWNWGPDFLGHGAASVGDWIPTFPDNHIVPKASEYDSKLAQKHIPEEWNPWQPSAFENYDGRVRVTIIAVKKQWVLHILSVFFCSFSCLVCSACAPFYTAICDLPGPTTFFHIISHAVRFSGKSFCTQNVLIFSIISAWNISHSKKNWARFDNRCILVYWSSCEASFILVRF